MGTDSDTRLDCGGKDVPKKMDILAAVMNARFALEYWIRETSVNAPEAGWAKNGRWRSRLECETLQWIEDHLRVELDIPLPLDPSLSNKNVGGAS